MPSINTGKILEKLERVIDFRVGEGASKRNKIILGEKDSCPATDGIKISLPRRENRFLSERNNELYLGNVTAHESDHIREFNQYFGTETDVLREKSTNLVQEYCQRNYSHLEENPALAGWVDNVVKDRRIDYERKEQLTGVKKFHQEVIDPICLYLRPSIQGMSELDSFREQYLQKALLGKVNEPIPKEHKQLLEEIVSITNSSNSIQEDKEVVTRVYELFKENFDIKRPISKLPPMFGCGDHSQQESGSPQKGYGKETKEREGRDNNDKRPKWLNEGEGKPYESKDIEKGQAGGEDKDKQKERDKEEKENDNDFYKQASKKHGIKIHIVETKFKHNISDKEKDIRDQYSGEIESMKRIFRRLQLKHYGDKRYFHGQELDYEDYMQSELESKVTRIKGGGKHFRLDTINEQRPVFGIHADTSGSTEGEIIEKIKVAFYIVGNALSSSNWNYGLYSSADNLKVIKDPTKRWNDNINGNIMELESGGSGIYLHKTSSVISEDLMRIKGNPKCLIVISDFEVCGDKDKERKTAEELQKSRVYPFYIAIGKEHEENAKSMVQNIGEEHYSVVPLDKLNELPGEIFRLFKTFGIAR